MKQASFINELNAWKAGKLDSSPVAADGTSYNAGRWYVSLSGVAAQFHHQRRSAKGRHQVPAGADRGVKFLIVAADAEGNEFDRWEGVKPLREAEQKLRWANKALSRTKKGSFGRAKARARLAKLHKHIADQRGRVTHQASYDLATKWLTA